MYTVDIVQQVIQVGIALFMQIYDMIDHLLLDVQSN